MLRICVHVDKYESHVTWNMLFCYYMGKLPIYGKTVRRWNSSYLCVLQCGSAVFRHGKMHCSSITPNVLDYSLVTWALCWHAMLSLSLSLSLSLFICSLKNLTDSLSCSSDGETFISADDLRINLWNLEISNQSFNIVDVKPANMEDLTGRVLNIFWSELPYKSQCLGRFISIFFICFSIYVLFFWRLRFMRWNVL